MVLEISMVPRPEKGGESMGPAPGIAVASASAVDNRRFPNASAKPAKGLDTLFAPVDRGEFNGREPGAPGPGGAVGLVLERTGRQAN